MRRFGLMVCVKGGFAAIINLRERILLKALRMHLGLWVLNKRGSYGLVLFLYVNLLRDNYLDTVFNNVTRFARCYFQL